MSIEEARTAQRERFDEWYDAGPYGNCDAYIQERMWAAWQAAEASGLREAARIAKETAKEVGGAFADTHRLNTGLNKFRSAIRERAREVEGK